MSRKGKSSVQGHIASEGTHWASELGSLAPGATCSLSLSTVARKTTLPACETGHLENKMEVA